MSRLDTAGLASPGSADHPLSPASTPQGGRRASSAHTYTAQGSKRQDYFGSHSNSSKQARPSRPRTHASQLPAEKHPQPDAAYKLSPTPSRRSGDVFTGLGIEKGNDATGMVLDSLTRIELAVVEERFDLMSDEEINRFLNEYGKYSSGDVLSTPRAARRARDDQADSPLFPPSPPSEAQLDQPDHPLRILSRAVREMQEAVKRVQAENVRLQEELQRYRPVKPANAMSLSDGLEEALSTSLTSPSPLAARTAPTHSEPTSFVPTRPKSPTPSIAASITPSIASQDSRMKKDIRSTWTATLWGWGGAKKNGRRRDSSTSHVGTKTQLDLNVPIPPDEEEWRKGDGGSPPSFVAVFLATRLITPDASSILSNDAQPLVARLAHALVSAARDEDIAPREAPGRRRSRENRSRAASAASSLHPPPPAQTEPSKGYDALATTASIGRSLLSTVSGATLRSMRGDDAARPALIARTSSAQVYPTTAVVKPVVTVEPLPSTPLPSVEMASIVADEYQPPTVMLSRQNLGSFFQTNKSGKLHTATRFQGSDPPLTDRYGFIYDIQHASMLKDASAAGAPAPASLSGLIPDDDAWIERKRPKADSIRSVGMERQSSSSSNTPRDQPSTPAPAPGETHRHRNSVSLKLGPTPAKAVTAKDTQPVSSRGASSLQPSNSPSLAAAATVPSPSPAVSRLTVSSLLDQLTEIHDRQQDERKRAWDKWMRKRSNNGTDKTGWSGDMIGVSQMGLAKDADDWKSFAKLVRRGIPLAYRAKIWAECSGATDAIVPGEYAEILSVHANDKSPVQADIEKDVTRTFPSNVYFGGDGHGVPKLRRVLLAYAWRNPNVGYCQGMNMLAATLLLTHTEEEQAFWVLCCMIDRMLPQDYYTPTLLGSRVDQMVLQDLVAAHLPKVSLHLDKLGVDLASVTFGWFLSLFTDCLPVETLFCVWDLFFVEGHDCLFRVAIAILKLNEADLLTCDSAGDLFALVGGMTGRLWAAEKLIQLQHAYRPLITHAEIAQRSATHLAALQPE